MTLHFRPARGGRRALGGKAATGRKRCVIALLMAAGAPISGASAAWVGQPPQPASVASPLVLGLLLPPEEPEAASIREGALLAVEEANWSSGLPVRLVVRGRTGPWGSDASEAALLVTEDGATGLIGPTEGTACHLLLQVAGRTHVPVVLLCPEASLTRAAVPWVARVVPRTLDEARALFSGIDPRTRAGRPGNRMSRLRLTSAHGGSFLPLPPPAWQPTGSRATGRGPAEDRKAEP